MSRDALKPIAYADVPELAALIEYVRRRDDLSPRVGITSATGNAELQERMFTYEVADLPLSLLDRARATGATTDDDLLTLYLERERAWLLDPLPLEYVIPLALTALDVDAVLTIDDRTGIEPLDEATQAVRAPSESSVTSVPDPVVSAATHAIVLSDANSRTPVQDRGSLAGTMSRLRPKTPTLSVRRCGFSLTSTSDTRRCWAVRWGGPIFGFTTCRR